ncbi:hypothetical protein FRX31_012692 [Thalictrum thalictroides]|uniref:Uncharacterized protein n=1 Tax=Thalictrum thalictroides TaxID=46969 RepID=A0A7J6WK14_THATH|nr:hypothetical protein FRX31_012692 [Thalictrum thalictroides]
MNSSLPTIINSSTDFPILVFPKCGIHIEHSRIFIHHLLHGCTPYTDSIFPIHGHKMVCSFSNHFSSITILFGLLKTSRGLTGITLCASMDDNKTTWCFSRMRVAESWWLYYGGFFLAVRVSSATQCKTQAKREKVQSGHKGNIKQYQDSTILFGFVGDG